ncbi:MAG TPA: hypothetical protein PLK34_00105 [Candidatus Pacearchaeota archaeon]|nr:hypothetical protein [Candidatus Pacearchaeota archaeon]
MIQKRRCIILGLIVSSVGILILLNSLRLNGFAISEIFNDFRSYLLPLVFFIGGILIASSGDSLQAYLEAREAENPSPSLEDKLQSPEESQYFTEREHASKVRKDTGKPFQYNLIQKMLRKNKGLNLEPEESFKEEYTGRLKKKGEDREIIGKPGWGSEKTVSYWETATLPSEKDENGEWVNKPKYTTREHKLNEETKKIERLRGRLKQREKEIPSAENPEKLHELYPQQISDVDSLSKIFKTGGSDYGDAYTRKQFEKNKLPRDSIFSPDEGSSFYKKATLEKRKKFDLKKAKEESDKLLSKYNADLIKDTIENKTPFSDEIYEENKHWAGVTSSNVARQHHFFEKLINSIRGYKQNREDLVTMDKLREIYENQAKTVPISNYTDNHLFIHALRNPLSKDTYLSPGKDTTQPSLQGLNRPYEDQLNTLSELSPFLSVSSTPKKRIQTNLFNERATGIILEEGDIYDASRHDLFSRGISGKRVKTRRKNPRLDPSDDGEASLEIEHRAKQALLGPSNPQWRHNEFIVGNYKIGGFVLNPDLFYKIGQNASEVYENSSSVRRREIQKILDESERLNVPVFKYDSEKSSSPLTRVDPKDYKKEFLYRA